MMFELVFMAVVFLWNLAQLIRLEGQALEDKLKPHDKDKDIETGNPMDEADRQTVRQKSEAAALARLEGSRLRGQEGRADGANVAADNNVEMERAQADDTEQDLSDTDDTFESCESAEEE